MATRRFLLFFSAVFQLSLGKLDYVHAIFRGGDRSPSSVYPTDPNSIPGTWPNGWSQLTDRGQEEMKELGTFVKDRYVEELKLINPVFDEDQVFIRTTTKRRAAESARFFAETLFPGQITSISGDVPYWADLLLRPSSVHCEQYNVLEHHLNKEFYKELHYRHKRLFGFLSQMTGWDVSMSNIGDVYSAFYRERIHGLPQPDWINETIYDTVVELKRIQILSQYSNPILAKLRGGFLLGDVMKQISYIAERGNQPKLRVYSTHDSTMNALMYNMGIAGDHMVPYAALLLLEIHQRTDGYRFLRVFYRNGTQAPLQQLSIAGCLFQDCPLNQLKSLMETRMYKSKEELQEDCEGVEEKRKHVQENQYYVDETMKKAGVDEHQSDQVVKVYGSRLTTILGVATAILGAVILVQAMCLFRAIGNDKIY
ncbi:hypothetical protein L596_024932 [Steinernema carpocapsae]|uniref:Acid phosphatase n=1 Tax=Steinernema carpocapsae TaxID=34508 RepID=A0A4U5M699_STECR|nr:hypothetical protein L596_024932 [Steinernema carpocapsae]